MSLDVIIRRKISFVGCILIITAIELSKISSSFHRNLSLEFPVLKILSDIYFPPSDWSGLTPRYFTLSLAVTSLSPHINFMVDFLRIFLFEPKRILSVFPK